MSDEDRWRTDALALRSYAAMGSVVRSDADRWPTLSRDGLTRLVSWRGHPNAPDWIHETGDLLTETDHESLKGWRASLATTGRPTAALGAQPPGWVNRLVERCSVHTRFYRTSREVAFSSLPTITRAHLAERLADFVPDDIDLERVVQGTSSGSTGSALVVPLHPVEISRSVVLLEHLLDELSVPWPHDLDRFALLSVVDQLQAFTYASVMTYRGEQMMARINLDAAAWRRTGDREAFIQAARPQVVTGSALSLLRLAELDVNLSPIALVSGAVHLTPAARAVLTSRFAVPLLDLYGLKETGPVAVSCDGGPHVVVPRQVYVEVFDDQDRPLPDGVRGELTVTVDGNPYLPLLRYRTGDTGILEWRQGRQHIKGLDGRAPVTFRAADGHPVPSVDLTQQLQHLGALAWSIHQDGADSVRARIVGGSASEIARALETLLGDIVAVDAVADIAELGPGKPRRFSSDILDA